MNLLDALKKRILLFDGAMGTMVQRAGLKGGELPELYNMEKPDIISFIHRAYIEAGSDIITTNTFGANEYKLEKTPYSPEDVIERAVSLAREAAGKDRWVALDLGPLGQLIEPNGMLSFDEVYEAYARQIRAGAKAGADLVLIETVGDLYEMKAAVLAAKENSDLPVFASLSFGDGGRTMMGNDPETVVNVLEGLGVDALGANCSLGPKELLPIVKELIEFASVPVIIQANAGLPALIDGETVFEMEAKEFVDYGRKMLEMGLSIIGGCCGTDPDFIRGLRKEIDSLDGPVIRAKAPRKPKVSSSSRTITLGEDICLIGERINSNGSSKIKEAISEGDIDELVSEAIEQMMAGAKVLDINIGTPDIDQVETMKEIVKELQPMVNVPLQFDSTDPDVIEAGLRLYNGKAIINSVTGEESSMERIFPLAKKYGALLIALTLDEGGIPKKAEDRLEIAKRIIEKGKEYGIPKEDIIIDPLVLASATNPELSLETLKALRLIKEETGLVTMLGISNISFGLPNRSLLNQTFLAMALGSGLDCPISDPLDDSIIETIDAFRSMTGKDKDFKNYIDKYR